MIPEEKSNTSYTNQELEEFFTGPWGAEKYTELASKISTSIEDIKQFFDLNLHKDKRIAWRSAYVLDMAHEKNPAILECIIPDLLERFPKLTNESIKRHYGRILAMHNINELATGDTIDCCIEWLLAESTAIAVKAHCMQILFNLTTTYPELGNELKIVLEEVIPKGSTGVKNRARKLIQEIERRKLV